MKRNVILFLVVAILGLSVFCVVLAVEEIPGLILVTVYQQVGWGDKLEIGAVDEKGGLWTWQNETGAMECPSDPTEAESYIRSLDLSSKGQLETKELNRLKGLVLCVTACGGSSEPAANDAGTQISWAGRNGKNQAKETVILGMSGDDLLENTDPAAQELYAVLRTLFPEVTDYSNDHMISPKGFQPVPLAEFCGYQNTHFNEIQLSAWDRDCEEGQKEITPAMTVEELLSLTVTGKENCESVTGGTVTYLLSDKNNQVLASFEFYGDLLVMKDGMYRVE